MDALCHCSRHLIDLKEAPFVVNNVPFCQHNCFSRYVQAKLDRAKQLHLCEQAARDGGA